MSFSRIVYIRIIYKHIVIYFVCAAGTSLTLYYNIMLCVRACVVRFTSLCDTGSGAGGWPDSGRICLLSGKPVANTNFPDGGSSFSGSARTTLWRVSASEAERRRANEEVAIESGGGAVGMYIVMICIIFTCEYRPQMIMTNAMQNLCARVLGVLVKNLADREENLRPGLRGGTHVVTRTVCAAHIFAVPFTAHTQDP